MLIGYFTIERNEKLEDVISKIKRQTGTVYYRPLFRGIGLTGNQKVLTLNKTYNTSEFIKIDGPGFLIDELFDHFCTT